MKNASLDLLRQMKLQGMADAYESILHLPINKQPEAHELLAQLTDAELQNRAHKKMEMFIRLKIIFNHLIAEFYMSYTSYHFQVR